MFKYLGLLCVFYLFIGLLKCQDPSVIQLFDPRAQCRPYIGDPESTLLCENRLFNSDSIYTRNSSSQYIAQEIVKSLLFQVSTSKQCNIEPIRVGVCSLNLPFCNTVVVGNLTFGLPSSICKADCLGLMEICPLFKGSIDCDNPFQFPEKSTFYNLSMVGGPAYYEVQCTHPSLVKGSSYNQQICPRPLLVKNQSLPEFAAEEGYNYVGETDCVMPCPINFYTDDQWNKLYKMSTVVSSVSFSGTLFVALTYGPLNFNNKQTIQTVSVCLFAFSVWLMNCMDIITSGIGYRNLLCPLPGKLAVQSDTSCGVTGAFFHFGVMSCILWWSTIGFHLLCKIKRWKFSFLRIRNVLAFNISVAVIMLIVPLAKKNIKAGNGVLGCWVVDAVNGYFYIPYAVVLVFGAVCICWVMKEIYSIVRTVHNDTRFIKMQIKPIICLFLVFGSYFYIFSAHFYLDSEKDSYLESMEGYILCISQPFLSEEQYSLCKSKGPKYGVLFAFYFLIRFFGVFIFIFYAITPTTKQVWLNSFIFRNRYMVSMLNALSIKLDSNYLVTSNSFKNSQNSAKHTTGLDSLRSTELDTMHDDTSKVSNDENTK